MGDTIATLGIKVSSTGVKETSENLDKVTKSSEKAQKAIDKLLESYKQQEIRAKGGKAGLAEYKLSLLGATEAEKKFAAETIKATEALQAANKITKEQSSLIKASTIAYASSIAAVVMLAHKLGSLVKESILFSARYETLGVVLENIGKTASYSNIELNRTAEALQKQGISMQASREATIKMIQAHIDLSQAQKLGRIAQDAAVIGNVNSSHALERLVYGIQTAQIEVLKSIGLNVNFENSYKKLAAQLGKNASSLTESEKTQARLNVVLERGADIAGTYEAAMTTAGKQLTSFSRYIDDYKVKFGEAFNNATTNVVKEATEYLQLLTQSISSDETQTGLKQFADGIATILSLFLKLAKVGAEITKYIGLVGNLGENLKIEQKGLDLVNQGLIDQIKYTKASWEEKKKLIAAAEPITKITKKINEQTEGYKLYADQITKSAEEERKRKKEAAEAAEKAIQQTKNAADEEKKRVKFIEDYIAKLEQEADTYKKGKEYTADYILGLKDATEAQKQRAKVAGAFIDEAKRLDAAEKKNKKNLEDYAALMKKVMPEFERDELSRQQALELTATIFKDKLTPAMMGTAAALHLFDEQSEAIKNINEYFDTKEIDDFTKKTDELKDKLKFEGTSFGNDIADGINNAVISMQKFNDQLDKQTKYQKDIDKLQKEIDTTSNLDLKAKKQKEMDDLAQEGIKGQLSAYRQLFGTTSQLFKENSKERKALHNLEMAFAMAEIAMNLQKTISAAYTAIMTQGTGDPYSAFGRIAAMTALAGGIVAAAGGSLSGGGSGSAPTAVSSASQSTALGSTEQSQSIANAFSFLEDIESGQYNELKDISSSMKDLNKNITGLVTSIVRTGGVSEFAGTAGTSGGTSFSQDMLTKYANPFGGAGAVFTDFYAGVYDKIPIIGDLLGGVSNFVDDLTANISNAIFGGSKKTSILSSGLQITPGTIESGQYSTQAYADIKVKKEGGLFGSDKTYFKTLTDEVDQSVQDMVSLVFKNMGETMVDIAKGLGTENLEEVFNYVFDIGKIDLKGLDTEGINKALQEAFSTASDKAATDLFGELIGRYQKIGEGILETAVRLVGEKAVIMDVLELTNQGFDGSDIPAKALEVTQALIDMAGGLDNLTDAAATYYDKFFSDAEKQTRLQGQLTESFSSLNLELPKTREGYRAIVEGLDLTTEAGQKTYVSLLGLSEGADKYYTSLENGNKVLAENQKNILSINSGLEKSIAQMDMTPFEKSLDDVNTSTANTIKTLKDYGATEDQLANARLYGQKQIDFLTKAEEKRIEDLEKANKRLYDNKMVELLEAEGKSTEALILKRQLELDNMDESLVPMQKRIYELQDESKALELSIKANKEFTESILANIQAQEDAKKSQEDRVNNSSYELYLELLREEGKISSAQNLERKAKLNELNHIALEDTQKEIWALQDKRKQQEMMVTILELEGKTTESIMLARKLEFATMEESLKPLQNRIWQLQDEAKIKELSNSITSKTIEILKLQGKEEEALAIQRKMEIEALDPALREFQKIIYVLEDAKKAEEESAKATEERIQKEIAKNNMLIELLELEGNTSDALKIKRMLEISAVDESLRPMQERIWALQDEAKETAAANQRADVQKSLLQRLYTLQGKDSEVLRMQREAEIESLGSAYLPMLKRIYQLEDEKKATEAATEALEKAKEERSELLTKAEDDLKKSIDKQISIYQELADEANKILEESRSLLDRSFENEKEKITKRHEELIAGLTLRLDEAQTAASDLENVFNSLSDARKSMEGASGGLTYKAVQKQLVDAITMAKTGNLSGAKELVPNLGILTSQGAENYSSQQDFKRDFFKTYNSLSELEKLTGQQLTDQQQIVKNLENQIALENTNHAASMAALQAQYDAVIGVNNSVISFQEAITQYQKAQYEADGANALLKSQTEILNNQLNALLGIDTGILSVEAAINNLIAAQEALSLISQSSSIPAFASGGVHYGGLRIVGESGPELEYTPPANITSNNDLKSMMSNEEIVAELKAMRTEMARANFEIVKNTADSSKTLKKFDYDGMPETRTA